MQFYLFLTLEKTLSQRPLWWLALDVITGRSLSRGISVQGVLSSGGVTPLWTEWQDRCKNITFP